MSSQVAPQETFLKLQILVKRRLAIETNKVCESPAWEPGLITVAGSQVWRTTVPKGGEGFRGGTDVGSQQIRRHMMMHVTSPGIKECGKTTSYAGYSLASSFSLQH